MQSTSSFHAIVTLPCLENKQIKVEITQGQNIKDIVSHLVQIYAIPPYVTTSLHSILLSAMQTHETKTLKTVCPERRHLLINKYQTNTLLYNTKQDEDIFPRAYHTLVHCPISSIFDTLLELEQSYAIAIQELQTASDHELVAIQQRQALEIENNNPATSNDSNSSSPVLVHNSTVDMTTLFSRQVEEMEVFQATWQSDIMQTQQTQRTEYREFVIELYKEYQSRLSDHKKKEEEIKKLDGKEMIELAASRVKQWDQQQQAVESTTSSNSRKRTGSFVDSIHSNTSNHSKYSPNELIATVQQPLPILSPDLVKHIQEMGFEQEQAETALLLTNSNIEQAIALLLENPAKVDAYLSEQKLHQQEKFSQITRPPASSSTPYRRSHSKSQPIVPRPTNISSTPTLPNRNSTASASSASSSSRRQSLQRFTTTPTFLNMMNSGKDKSNSPPLPALPPTVNHTAGNNPSKSWNPISFLQQQKQAMENTNLSSVRKLGGWLGKAMENLGIEHDGEEIEGHPSSKYMIQPPRPQQLVESFTIMMGTTQIKSSHNLRLLVTDEATDLFHPPYDSGREMAYRAETATKLYTSHLSAMIVLVELNELAERKNGWRQYRTGKGSNKALFERCQQSTEFHFSDIEHQLQVIEQDFVHHGGLIEGAFFVTKHSNLPSTQVVFHLIIDHSAITAVDLSNRHALIVGLRNILRMTTQFDISSLSIPLLLLPDRFNNEQGPRGDVWLQKRGEVVMKCIKGFLIENSRSGKRVQNEGLDRGESMAGGGMRNIEFLLPHKSNMYSTTMPLSPTTATTPLEVTNTDVPQEVQMAFQQFRTLLVNLFRTS